MEELAARRTLLPSELKGMEPEFEATEAYRFRNSQSPHVPSLIVYDGTAGFCGLIQGIVVCADAKTGEQLWQARVGSNYFSSPVCINGLLYNPLGRRPGGRHWHG